MDEIKRSRTTERLEAARALVAELEAKALQEAQGNTVPIEQRQLAVKLHTRGCTQDAKGHASLACPWHATPDADEPKLADWTDPTHAWWLALAGVVLEPEEKGAAPAKR